MADSKGVAAGVACTHRREAQWPCASTPKWWEALVTLQFVTSDFVFVTPDLQSGNRIASLTYW